MRNLILPRKGKSTCQTRRAQKCLRNENPLETHYFRYFLWARDEDKVKKKMVYSRIGRSCAIVVAVAMCAGLLSRQSFAQKQTQAEHAERKVLAKVDPVYPELAKRMHLSGVVKIEAVVRSNGNVKSTKIMGGNPVLVESASDAVRKWKFETSSSDSVEIVQLTFEAR